MPGKFGALNTPSVAYAAFNPRFRWDKESGLFAGGLFWNGRAATLQEQAGNPILNPVEMAMPSAWAVVTRLAENDGYRQAFRKLYQLDLAAIPANEKRPEMTQSALFQPTPTNPDKLLAQAPYVRFSSDRYCRVPPHFLVAGVPPGVPRGVTINTHSRGHGDAFAWRAATGGVTTEDYEHVQGRPLSPRSILAALWSRRVVAISFLHTIALASCVGGAAPSWIYQELGRS